MTKQRAKNKTHYVKYCEFCSIKFESTRSDAKFCNASHKAMHHEGIRRNLAESKRAEIRNRIDELIQEVGKPAKGPEVDETRAWLRDWLSELMDKILLAVRSGDLKALEKINTKLSEVTKKVELIENE